MAGRVVVALLVSLVALMSRVTAREFDYCYSYESDPYLLMGTKTAYQFVQGKNGLPPIPSCTPVQIWVLSRHGTRYPDRTTILQMSTLSKLRDQIIYNHDNRGNGRLCDADLGHLKSWQMNPRVNDNTADFLTIPQGEQDMRLLAKRLQSGFPELLRPNPLNINHQNYRFRSTQAQRTRASLDSFMEGLFNNRDAVPADISPPDDTLLRAAKNCPTWESSLERDRVDYESELFVNSYEYQNLLQNVSRRLGFLHRINNESIELMYDMCRYEKAWDVSRLSPWCSVFNKEEMKILEYHEDLHFFYYSGPGRDINRRLGCPLIKDMFNHFKMLERGNFGDEPKGIFYFAHTGALQSLLTALDIGKDSVPLLASNYYNMGRRSYRTSKQNAFASNLVAVFYRCSDPRSPNKVMFYLNEAPVLLDGCRVGLCDWDYLKDRFGQFANECNLNFCTDPNSAPVSTITPLLIVLASIATYIVSSPRS